MRAHKFLLAPAAVGALALGLYVNSVEAAPVVGGTAIVASAPASVEPVFFFRCGFFGNRCRRHHRDGRRGY